MAGAAAGGRSAGGPAGPVPPDVAARAGRGPGRQADRGDLSSARAVPGEPARRASGRARHRGPGPVRRPGPGGDRGVRARLSAWPTPGARSSPSACPACWRQRTSPCWMPGRGRGCRRSRCSTACPGRRCGEARWWQRHIVEVLTGVPPDAEEGTVPQAGVRPGGCHADPPGAGQGGRADGRRAPGDRERDRQAAAPLPGAGPGRHGRSPGRQADAPARPGRCRRGRGHAAGDQRGRRTSRRGRRRSCSGGPGRSSPSPAGTRLRAAVESGLFTACSAGCRPAGTRPGRRGPAGRWLPAPRGRSGRWRRPRPAT